VSDDNGHLLGTTQIGSGSNGVIYKFDLASSQETVLYGFTGLDGKSPNGLVRDTAGNLYGSTVLGGTGGPFGYGYGTVFRFDTTGTLTILHTFTGGVDGYYPAGLALDGQGNIYGGVGGFAVTGNGFLFEITP
jgi:uncharacterized repeat protein (TIGR03803 family)